MREFLDIVRERHSARTAFDPELPVGDEQLHRVLDAARWAPTAHNMQNYEVVVVDDPERLDEIARIRSEVSEAFIRENFEQLSFSEDELRRKKTGALARMFPRRGSHLTDPPSTGRIMSTRSWAVSSEVRRCSSSWSTTRPDGPPPPRATSLDS